MSFFNWLSGSLGEFAVNLTTQWNLDREKYHLIKNVTLPTSNGTTQIDHVIISRYGIFVVETKKMKGWIFGGEHQKFWTQSLFKQKNKFQNPVHQNYKHVKTLESLLKINEDKIFSIVVFVGEVTFKTKMPDNVLFRHEYTDYINSKSEVLLSEPEKRSIINQIENGRLVASFKTNIAHIKHVDNIIANKNKNVHINNIVHGGGEIPFCPKCDAVMIKRKTKKGKHIGKEFWGCSNFPKCRNITQV